MNGFDILVGSSLPEIETQLLSLVLPRTCGKEGQGSKEWFLDRMFSGTSYQIHALILAAGPLLLADDDIDNNVKKALQGTFVC